MDGNSNVATSRERDVGVFIGGDHGVGNGWRLGGAFGYTDSRITVDDRSAKSDVNSYSAILYSGRSFEAGSGKINFTAGLAYTWHDIDSKRNINAAGERQELKADYSASTGQIFTDVGYAIPLTDRVTLEPFFGADFSDLRTPRLLGVGWRRGAQRQEQHQQRGHDHAGPACADHLRREGNRRPPAWHAGDGAMPTATSIRKPRCRSTAASPSPWRATRWRAMPRSWKLGVDLAMSKNATLGLAYAGQFGDGNRQNTGTVNVSWRF